MTTEDEVVEQGRVLNLNSGEEISVRGEVFAGVPAALFNVSPSNLPQRGKGMPDFVIMTLEERGNDEITQPSLLDMLSKFQDTNYVKNLNNNYKCYLDGIVR